MKYTDKHRTVDIKVKAARHCAKVGNGVERNGSEIDSQPVVFNEILKGTALDASNQVNNLE